MDQNDLGRAVVAGLQLGRAAVGAGVAIALTPLRLVKHAISPPSEPEPAAWSPPPQPAPPPPAPVPVREEAEPAPPPEAPAPPPPPPPEPEPEPAPEPAADVPRTNDLSAADAARRREEEREEETDDDSPGPEIRVDEPWEGYDRMNVGQVLERLGGADPTVRAMVRLYEETHKNRKGILRATE